MIKLIALLVLLFPVAVTAAELNVSKAAPEAQAYSQCVYELRSVDVNKLAEKTKDPETLANMIVAEAFQGCKPEEQALRELGRKRGMTEPEIQQKMDETNAALEKAIRYTLAKELVLDVAAKIASPSTPQ